MRNFTPLYLFLFFAIFISCDKNENYIPTEDVAIQDYMWKGMNLYYLWQEENIFLNDDTFKTQGDLNESLAQYPDLNRFFYDQLVYQYQVVDRFSWVVDDYIELENSFQGVSLSNGIEYGLFTTENTGDRVFGIVRYILPDSDAVGKDVARGDLFNRINGNELNLSNYRSLLFGLDDYTMGFADYNGGDIMSNSKEIAFSKSQYTENPVYLTKTIDYNGVKVGYLMYNSFTSNFDQDLNDAMGQLKAEGVEELVLDLRYNSGGSVRSATYLGQMITGQFTGEIYNRERWNAKVMDYFERDYNDTFFPSEMHTGETINTLGLNRVYVLTTGSTASASELVINCLRPYIEVKTIGTQSVGKFVASVTLYDSDDFTRDGANLADHTYAMQPIVLEELNANLENNNHQGFIPSQGFLLKEDYDNMGVLGEITEPYLNLALEDIAPSMARNSGFRFITNSLEYELISSSKSNLPVFEQMYKEDFKKLPLNEKKN
jgi:hypothetical protein